MTIKCMTVFCKSRGTMPGITYFRLTPERHDDWMRAIGRDPTREHLSEGNRICSLHFAKEDLISMPKGIVLKKGAIPRLNMGIRRGFVPQPHLQPQIPASQEILRLNNGIIRYLPPPQSSPILPREQEIVPPEPVTILPHMVQQVALHQTVSGLPQLMSYGTVAEESGGEICIKQEPETENVTERTQPVGNCSLNNVNNSDNEKVAQFITKRTIDKNQGRLKELKLKNRKLARRLRKVNSLLENLGSKCDISEVTKQLLLGQNNAVNNADDSSTDSADEIVEESGGIKIEVDENDIFANHVSVVEHIKPDVVIIDDDEEQNTQTNSFSTDGHDSQVQITFLAGMDTAKEGLLKRKLKQLAENDVIKSRKIRELNNIIFIKNKLISELKEEITKLKSDQQNRTQVPILKILQQNGRI